eukprot:4160072-Alexandrium_andersonii.AAC.1
MCIRDRFWTQRSSGRSRHGCPEREEPESRVDAVIGGPPRAVEGPDVVGAGHPGQVLVDAEEAHLDLHDHKGGGPRCRP